jgi:hypothetical protein
MAFWSFLGEVVTQIMTPNTTDLCEDSWMAGYQYGLGNGHGQRDELPAEHPHEPPTDSGAHFGHDGYGDGFGDAVLC